MKHIISILIMMLGISSQAQSLSNITATLTIIGDATNGNTFSVNGHSRAWTNNVTSVATMIATNGNYNFHIIGTQTNLLDAYLIYPETSPFIIVTTNGTTNQIVFSSLYSTSPALTLGTNWPAGTTNWASWTYFTNTLTNETVVRVPTNGISIYERTNVENGLVGLLGSLDGLNGPVSSLGSMWTNFFNTALQNPVPTNGYFEAQGDLVRWKTNFSTTATSAYTVWTNSYFTAQTNGILGCKITITAGNKTNSAMTNIVYGSYDSTFFMTTSSGSAPQGFMLTNGTQFGTALASITNTYASTGAITIQLTPATVSLENWTVEVDVRANPRPAVWPVLPGP